MRSLLAGLRWTLIPLAVVGGIGGIATLSTPASGGTGFLLGWNLPEGANSHWVALGDVDGDFDIDAYVTEFYAPDVLWLNDGSGVFSRSPQVLDSGYGSCALLAPLDNNGSLDLFLGRHLMVNRVWLNNGTGTFTDSGQSIGSSFSRRGGALGDLDGDLDLDAFIPTDSSGSTNEVYFNNGAGVFTNSGQALGNYFSRAVALGDVDGDLDLDALLGNNGGNKLWKNNGSGVFSDSGQTVGGEGTFDVALGDLDGDTDLDAFFANGSSSGDPDEVWLNDGVGIFTDSGQNLDDNYSFSVVLFQCDGDNDLDAFVGNNTGQPNRLYLNDGNGVFSDSGQAMGVGGAISVAAADVDGDTDLDLFLANLTQPEQVFLNDGLCQFTPSGQVLGGSSAEAVGTGDIDGDGDLDAVLGTYGGIVRVLRNDGEGAFEDDDQWLASDGFPAAIAVQLADFDGDDDLDAWTGLCCVGSGATDDPADRIWTNDGSGIFTDSGQLLGSDYAVDGAIGDVDGDLDIDIVVANYDSLFSDGTNRLYLNDGSGVFTQSPQALGTGLFGAVALGRLDADADLDIFFARLGGPARVWRNNGLGVFTGLAPVASTAVTYDVALGDLDGDDDLDAYLANEDADYVWFNNGNGVFTDSLQALGSLVTVAVHLLDVDRDGDLDAWTTNGQGSTEANKVWLNDGAGQFTDSGWAVGATSSTDSAIGNLDGDADLDILIVTFDGNHQAWINQESGPLFLDGFEAGNMNAWSAVVP